MSQTVGIATITYVPLPLGVSASQTGIQAPTAIDHSSSPQGCEVGVEGRRRRKNGMGWSEGRRRGCCCYAVIGQGSDDNTEILGSIPIMLERPSASVL